MYSSAAQKPTVDSIALSRNTSLKQLYYGKPSNQYMSSSTVSSCITTNLQTINSSNSCNNDAENLTVSYPCKSQSKNPCNSNINISSSLEVNEIHLNIVTDPRTSKDFDSKCLNINIHRKNFNFDNFDKKFPEITLSVDKSDNTFNISIANNSKSIKKCPKKRKKYFISRLANLFAHRSTANYLHDKHPHIQSPRFCIEEKYNLNNGAINLSNDDLFITLNNIKPTNLNGGKINLSTIQLAGCAQKEIEREKFINEIHSFNETNEIVDELDDYMNEIKTREKI